MRQAGAIALVILAAGIAASADALEPGRSTLVAEALAAYEAAQSQPARAARMAGFEQAERLFSEAARIAPDSPGLHAAAGAAAMQAEHLGPAVLAFRRALRLDPDHPRAAGNLEHLRSILPEWLPRPAGPDALDTFFFWHRTLAATERAGAIAGLAVLAAALGAVGIARRSRLARSAAALALAAWATLVGSALLERVDSSEAAVVVAAEAIARASDSENAPVRFAEPLPSGTEVILLERRERWSRIRLANGQEAWLAAGALATVVPRER